MTLNTLSIDERVKRGKAKESTILDTLAELPIALGGELVMSWEESTEYEDKHLKVDAWAHTDSYRYSVAIKFRESGKDVGVAVLMPWNPDEFYERYETDALPWDRDMREVADYYIVQIAGELIIAEGKLVHGICRRMVDELYEAGGFRYKSFTGPYGGIMLQQKTDEGGGYSYDQDKVLCYIPPKFLVQLGAKAYDV